MVPGMLVIEMLAFSQCSLEDISSVDLARGDCRVFPAELMVTDSTIAIPVSPNLPERIQTTKGRLAGRKEKERDAKERLDLRWQDAPIGGQVGYE